MCVIITVWHIIFSRITVVEGLNSLTILKAKSNDEFGSIVDADGLNSAVMVKEQESKEGILIVKFCEKILAC